MLLKVETAPSNIKFVRMTGPPVNLAAPGSIGMVLPGKQLPM